MAAHTYCSGPACLALTGEGSDYLAFADRRPGRFGRIALGSLWMMASVERADRFCWRLG